jgi:serine O-acetyltransferase
MESWDYIKSDLVRYVGRDQASLKKIIPAYRKYPSFRYSFWLRLAKHGNRITRYIANFFHRRLSFKYLIQISPGTDIGYGLYIGHHMCLVVHPSAKIGNNVNLSQFTTIGSNEGKAAVIEDNVYIGPNVNLIENVHIGANSTIGAGSVVTKDVPENATVAGVPAKVLNYYDPGRFVINRFPLSA